MPQQQQHHLGRMDQPQVEANAPIAFDPALLAWYDEVLSEKWTQPADIK